MNVLLLTDADVFAGTERHILDLSAALVAQGQTVTIACPVPAPLADKARAVGIRVLPVAKRPMPDFAASRILARELRCGRVDIIHAHNGRTHLLAVAAVTLAGRGKVVATQHFLAPNRTGRHGPKAWLAGKLHRWAEKHTAAFIAISQAVKDQMLIRADAPAEKITVVHNGTTEPQKTSPERIAALRQELGVGDSPMILCAARLQKEKDIPTLIKAFTALRFNGQNDGDSPQRTRRDAEATTTTGGLATEVTEDTEDDDAKKTGLAGQPAGRSSDKERVFAGVPQLLIAGEGDQGDECERLIAAMRFNDQNHGNSPQRTRRDAEDDDAKKTSLAGQPAGRGLAEAGQNCGAALQNSNLSSPVRLLGFRADVSALMAACDIFVLPAPAEPFGLVIIEAMALGKPVIAAGAGGPLEIVAAGVTGLLVPPQDPTAMAAAMSQLLTDPETARAMGTAGRQRFETHFTADRMAREMAGIYHKTMSEPAGKHFTAEDAG